MGISRYAMDHDAALRAQCVAGTALYREALISSGEMQGLKYGELVKAEISDLIGTLTSLLKKIRSERDLAEEKIAEAENALACLELENALSRPGNRLTLDQIVRAVSKRSGVTITDIKSDKRQHSIVCARHEFFYLATKLTDHSLPQIGRFCGGKDHTSVMNGRDRHKERMGIEE